MSSSSIRTVRLSPSTWAFPSPQTGGIQLDLVLVDQARLGRARDCGTLPALGAPWRFLLRGWPVVAHDFAPMVDPSRLGCPSNHGEAQAHTPSYTGSHGDRRRSGRRRARDSPAPSVRPLATQPALSQREALLRRRAHQAVAAHHSPPLACIREPPNVHRPAASQAARPHASPCSRDLCEGAGSTRGKSTSPACCQPLAVTRLPFSVAGSSRRTSGSHPPARNPESVPGPAAALLPYRPATASASRCPTCVAWPRSRRSADLCCSCIE
jgi:hypothetical protein